MTAKDFNRSPLETEMGFVKLALVTANAAMRFHSETTKDSVRLTS